MNSYSKYLLWITVLQYNEIKYRALVKWLAELAQDQEILGSGSATHSNFVCRQTFSSKIC